MRTFRDSVAKVTFPLKKHKKIRGKCPLCVPSPCGDVVLKWRFWLSQMFHQSMCFRPLAGMWFWNFCRFKERMISMFVSVPLRGCGFEMIPIFLKEEYIMCFRPLARMWFWNLCRASDYIVRVRFPSPCGDVVLKYCSLVDFWFWNGGLFPSPCGDVVLKLNVYDLDGKTLLLFPSPCGDVVLKWD